MADQRRKSTLPPRIESLLARLRWRIRLYMVLEGLALAVLWLGVTFWAGLAMDYLPVLAGSSEMPRWARAAFLSLISIGFLWIVYRWILRRVTAQLGASSLALVLERRFDRFRDGLVTTVELDQKPDHAADFDEKMLEQARDDVLAKLDDVRLLSVFNLSPLVVKCVAAAAVLGSLVFFYSTNAQAFEIWLGRMTLFSDAAWPRNAHIEVVGIEVRAGLGDATSGAAARLLEFDSQDVRVGRGADVGLVVRADADAVVIPDVCTVDYITEEQERGRASMMKVGQPRDAFQNYKYTGKPFKGILADVVFDVVGYDHRLRGFRIDVVDNPVVTRPTAYCVFPNYMVNEALSSWLPRTVPIDSGTRLPVGTKVVLQAESNKVLREVSLYDPTTRETETLTIAAPEEDANQDDARRFEHPLQPLKNDLALEITLLDADNVLSPQPYRLFIAAVADEPPGVSVVLHGISTAVTPDVVLPVKGRIRDDYGLDKSWFEVSVNDTDPLTYDLSVAADGEVDGALDFRALRSKPDGPELQPGQKLNFLVCASDKYDLTDEPHIGLGDSYQLDVVTAEELLALLEARELSLRQRFELIIEELTQTRDSLTRVLSETEGDTLAGAEPEDRRGDEPGSDNAAGQQNSAQRVAALQRLRVQQGQRQSQKSAQEVLGVAAGFQDIREELVNNRVDTEDRKDRLQEQIAKPLQLIGETMFPELDRRLQVLEEALNGDDGGENETGEINVAQSTSSAIEQTNDILIELDKVLQRMLELETFNELIGIVRGLLEDQQRLLDGTEHLRKKQALEFFDLPRGTPKAPGPPER